MLSLLPSSDEDDGLYGRHAGFCCSGSLCRLSQPDTIGPDTGPLHSTSADLMTMFMASDKSDTKIVQPVIMPFSRQCQADVNCPEQTQAAVVVVIHDEFANQLYTV